MPSLPTVFTYITERLRGNGAQIGVRALEITSAAMRFLEAIGNPADDEVAIAAYVASQLKPRDAEQAAAALGVPQDLIPTLTSAVRPDLQLTHVLGRGTRRQAAVAATVLFTWYALAAKGGNAGRMKELREASQSATLDGAKNRALAQTLLNEMDKIEIAPHSPPGETEFIFSISIDLVGSTDAKTRVMHVAKGDASKIDYLNGLIFSEFCRIEREFYRNAVRRDSTSPGVDFSKFFTVKGIGDEIWILCDAREQEIPELGHALIDAAIQVAVQSVEFLATENQDGPSFDQHFDYGNIEPINSPIKIFMDIVSHASSIGRIRDDALVDAIPGLLRDFHRRDPTPAEIAFAARRLCLSSYEPIGWTVFQEHRTDYIGHEIDRFFRTTKAAVAGTVTIGESMAQKMGLSFKPATPILLSVHIDQNTPLMAGHPADPVHACKRTLNADQLKGIGYSYDTYTLFAPRSLNGIYVQMNADSAYQEVAAMAPPDVVHRLCNFPPENTDN
jgi:hypothetical protein